MPSGYNLGTTCWNPTSSAYTLHNKHSAFDYPIGEESHSGKHCQARQKVYHQTIGLFSAERTDMDSKGLKERITSGLIVWLLVTIFIQPILSFTWKAILVVGGFVHQGYVDRIYRGAALGEHNAVGLLTFLLLTTYILMTMAGHWLDLVASTSTVLQRTYSVPRLLMNLPLALLMLILGFAFLVVFSLSMGKAVISASFSQRLTVLAPAISDMEYKTLKARWAGMQGKADYDALVTEMDRRATQLGVNLPPVRKP